MQSDCYGENVSGMGWRNCLINLADAVATGQILDEQSFPHLKRSWQPFAHTSGPAWFVRLGSWAQFRFRFRGPICLEIPSRVKRRRLSETAR
jgi:hypothetical protein